MPIILSGSVQGGKSRPVGIIVGFIISFSIVTLFSKALITYANINPDMLRHFSYAVLIALGVVMLSSYLTEKFTLLLQPIANLGTRSGSSLSTENGFFGGILFGSLIGLVWTPCAGPILAAVIVQAVVQETTLGTVMIVVAFAVGVSIPMLIIALLGRSIMQKFSFFKEKTVFFRKLLGLIIIASVFVLMYYTQITLALTNSGGSNERAIALQNALETPYTAPSIAGISGWINSKPLTLSGLKGKVVLIDFWTYSCINCIRTLPYLKSWYEKYHDKGFVIIGIHSPEFEFERNLANVKNAVKEYGIHYPVALDNQFATWKNYHNRYWPAHYLINKNGEVVYQHFGEGQYDVTENNIRFLLGEYSPVTSAHEVNYSSDQTPETYLGYARIENFANQKSIAKNKVSTYHYPKTLEDDFWALNGEWIMYPDKVVATKAGSAIKLRFNAKDIYAVMGPASGPLKVKINYPKHGSKMIKVNGNRLYTILSLPEADSGIIELVAEGAGLEVYTFTFGS